MSLVAMNACLVLAFLPWQFVGADELPPAMTPAPQTQESEHIFGTLLQVVDAVEGVTIFLSAVNSSETASSYENATFKGGHLPYQCGERRRRCNVTTIKESAGTREAAVTALHVGIALAVFNVTSNGSHFIDQYVLQLEPPLSCNFTSLVKISDPSDVTDHTLYAFCVNFLPVSDTDEVEMWVFSVYVNFDSLNESRLLLMFQQMFSFSSTGLSNPFFFGSDVCPTSRFVWYDDAMLYVLRIDGSDSSSLDTFDTTQEECYGNSVTQVKRLGNDRLLAYCSNNTAVELKVCEAGGNSVPFETYLTRFHCSENVYLEQNASLLELSNITIPHPLNTSSKYVADCIELSERFYFVVSSEDGTIVLTDVLENSTAILAKGATVSHKVFYNRFILYSNSTSTILLDLTCTSYTTPIQTWSEPFDLAALNLKEQPLCSTVDPSTMSTPQATPTHVTPVASVINNGTGRSGLTDGQIAGTVIGSGIVISVIFGIILAIGLYILYQKYYHAGNMRLNNRYLQPPTAVTPSSNDSTDRTIFLSSLSPIVRPSPSEPPGSVSARDVCYESGSGSIEVEAVTAEPSNNEPQLAM